MATLINSIHSDDDGFQHDPVNLDFCKSIQKHQREGLYQIKFLGCDTAWNYRFKGNRDADYEIILQEYVSLSNEPTPGIEAPPLEKISENYVSNPIVELFMFNGVRKWLLRR